VVNEELGVDTSIEQGSSGEFTVWSDGDLIYSKAETGRFPEHDEILAKLG
jgi:selT/selW/selH-like putative selenoprotein